MFTNLNLLSNILLNRPIPTPEAFGNHGMTFQAPEGSNVFRPGGRRPDQIIMDTSKAAGSTIEEIGQIVFGIVVILIIIKFIWDAVHFSSSGDNPNKREEAIRAMLVDCGCMAVLGSLTFIIGIAFEIFR